MYLFSYLFSQPSPDEDKIFRIVDNKMPVGVFQQMAQRGLVNVVPEIVSKHNFTGLLFVIVEREEVLNN